MLILTFETSQRFSEDMAYNQRVIAWGDEEAVPRVPRQDRVNGPGHPSNPQQAANMRGRAPGGAGRDRGPQEQQPEQSVLEQG